MDRWSRRPEPVRLPSRTFELSHRGRTWRLGGGRTGVMAVVNVTPDSFFGASRTPDPAEAVERGVRQVEAGAVALDVGGESTRPGAVPVGEAEELDRVLSVIEALAHRVDVPIAIDSYKANVARAAVAAGAAIVNDVSGGLLDPEMAATAARLDVPFIVGHLRGTPETMQSAPSYADAPSEVRRELEVRIERLVAAGLSRDRLLLDPGIGFGKRAIDNLALISRLDEIVAIGRPVVVGISRKGFLGEVSRRRGLADAGPDDRLEASLAAAVLAAERGAVLVRTHDVLATRRALAAAEAILHGI